MKNKDEYVELKDVMEATGITKQWIYKKVRQGAIRIKEPRKMKFNLQDALNIWKK